jgi:hypothetical protein
MFGDVQSFVVMTYIYFRLFNDRYQLHISVECWDDYIQCASKD